MKLSMPITKKKIKNHFTYAWWQYLLLLVIAIFGWNLLYTSTRYRPPENLKLEWYCDSYAGDIGEKHIDDLMDELHATVFTDMEEVTFSEVGRDETYGDMQLMVWVSAGQGDLYLLSKSRFQGLGAGAGLIDLQPYIDSGALNTEGIDLSGGYVADEDTGKLYLVGIPADGLTKLNEYGIMTDGAYLCALITGGNDENTVKLLNYLLENMRGEPAAK